MPLYRVDVGRDDEGLWLPKQHIANEHGANQRDVVLECAHHRAARGEGGGVGDGQLHAGADALLAASVFHFGIYRIADVKRDLQRKGHIVRAAL